MIPGERQPAGLSTQRTPGYNNLLRLMSFLHLTLYLFFKEQVSCKTLQDLGSMAVPWLPVQVKGKPWFAKMKKPYVLEGVCHYHREAGGVSQTPRALKDALAVSRQHAAADMTSTCQKGMGPRRNLGPLRCCTPSCARPEECTCSLKSCQHLQSALRELLSLPSPCICQKWTESCGFQPARLWLSNQQ